MNPINRLVGIPYQIGKESLYKCDCVGICWLYHKIIHGKDYPHRDGKRLLIRNAKHDLKRIVDVIETWASRVQYEDLNEGDIIILKTKESSGALGVMIDRRQVLHMDLDFGSRITKLSYFKDIFIRGYRPNESI